MTLRRTDAKAFGFFNARAAAELKPRRNTAWVLAAAVMVGFLAVPSFAGQVYLRGPDERGEGPLPTVTGMPPDVEDMGSFTVDVYAEDFPAFAGFQIEINFPAGFYRYGDFTWNDDFLPQISTIYKGATVGLMSTEYVNPLFPELGYIDKTIPPEEDMTAVNPPEMVWECHEGLTWLMTITFLYDATIEGTYQITVVPDHTAFGDADEAPLSYTIIPGSVTIGGARAGGSSAKTPVDQGATDNEADQPGDPCEHPPAGKP